MPDLWVFGYGSLMWRPGFDFIESQHALLRGAHRSLCVYSVIHRGTPWRPGLVLGLDAGGSCHGIAYRVGADAASATIKYLRAREQVTDVYREARRTITLLNTADQKVEALCYMVDRSHAQYSGRLPIAEQAEIVINGQGVSGHNIDYVANTLRHLDEMGLVESALAQVMTRIEAESSQAD